MILLEKIRFSFWWRINRIRFKRHNIKYGSGCIVHGPMFLKIAKDSKINIGNNFTYTSGLGLNPLCGNIRGTIATESDSMIEIGHHVSCSSTVIWASRHIKIGNYVSIGGGSIILDSDRHSLDYKYRRDVVTDQWHRKDSEVVIGDDVLIGTHCIILKGVHIGNRCVIGAGSVVTRDIPDDCIAAGNPAKVIKKIIQEKAND